MKAQYWS